MENLSWVVLLPPLVVLLCAAITHRLVLSLFVGIASAALIATNWSLQEATTLATKRSLAHLMDVNNIYLYAFLLAMGILVYLLEHTGGAQAFAKTVTRRIRSKRSAEAASLLLSTTLFIDDYLSTLTVGCIMRPIADQFGITRAKLAYLIHSMASPLVVLMPVSSWTAMFVANLTQAGVSPSLHAHTNAVRIVADPLFVFFQSIPFICYGILTVITTVVVVSTRTSFGPMRTHEQRAPVTPTAPLSTDINTRSRPGDLLIPVMVLVSVFILGTLYMGGFWLFGGTYSLLESFKNNTDTFLILLVACTIALATSIFIAHRHATLRVTALAHICIEGSKTMIPSISMLILASILSSIVSIDLGAGVYLAQLLSHGLPAWSLPAVFFAVGAAVSLLLGTSWVTIALLLPFAIPTVTMLTAASLPTTPNLLPFLFPVLGALFSGAVCGDHLSPVSQTTLMAATSCGVDPLVHAKTQFPYGIPVIVGSLIAFLILGFLAPYGLLVGSTCALAGGLSVCLLVLKICSS